MDKIKNVAQRLGIITVEDMERYTALELIMMIANKMNDYSDELKDLSDKVHYLLNEGTLAEVIQIFDEWLQDGTFDTLINQTALKELNDRVDETNAQLSAISFIATTREDVLEALNSTKSNIVISLPQHILNLDGIEINKSNVTFVGGNINGNIIINSIADTANVVFSGCTFNSDVVIKKGRIIHFEKCQFSNCDKSIYVSPTTDAKTHSISMVNIVNCHFTGVNYDLYIEKLPSHVNNLIANDFIFSHNTSNFAKITHIYADEIDGIVINANTLFFPNYITGGDSKFTKEYHIRIKKGDWINIENNQLFESGYECIYLTDCSHPNIHNNEIAWSGQRRMSSAIKVDKSPKTTKYLRPLITGNNISLSTKHGVELNGMCGANVCSNIYEVCSSNEQATHYIGAENLSSIEHYGTYIDNGGTGEVNHNVVNNNSLTGNLGVKLVNDLLQYNSMSFCVTSHYTSPTSTIEINNDNMIVLEFESQTTITTLLSGTVDKNKNDGNIVKIITLNNNAIIKNSETISLMGGKDLWLRKGDVVEFVCYQNVWQEVNSSYRNNDVTRKVTATTGDNIDVPPYTSTLTLEVSSPKSFATMVGYQEGQEVKFIALNGNTTLTTSDNIKLKGNEQTTVPINGVISFKYLGGTWFEVSRSY